MRGVRPPPARRFSSHIPFVVHVCSLDAALVWLWHFLSARGILLSPPTCSSLAGSGCNRPVAETWFKILHAWWTKNNCDWSHSWNKNSNLEISWSFTKIFLFPSKQLLYFYTFYVNVSGSRLLSPLVLWTSVPALRAECWDPSNLLWGWFQLPGFGSWAAE